MFTTGHESNSRLGVDRQLVNVTRSTTATLPSLMTPSLTNAPFQSMAHRWSQNHTQTTRTLRTLQASCPNLYSLTTKSDLLTERNGGNPGRRCLVMVGAQTNGNPSPQLEPSEARTRLIARSLPGSTAALESTDRPQHRPRIDRIPARRRNATDEVSITPATEERLPTRVGEWVGGGQIASLCAICCRIVLLTVVQLAFSL